jgi:hypothetical protein
MTRVTLRAHRQKLPPRQFALIDTILYTEFLEAHYGVPPLSGDTAAILSEGARSSPLVMHEYLFCTRQLSPLKYTLPSSPSSLSLSRSQPGLRKCPSEHTKETPIHHHYTPAARRDAQTQLDLRVHQDYRRWHAWADDVQARQAPDWLAHA